MMPVMHKNAGREEQREEQREVEWVHHISAGIMGDSTHTGKENKLVAETLWSFPVNRQLPLDS